MRKKTSEQPDSKLEAILATFTVKDINSLLSRLPIEGESEILDELYNEIRNIALKKILNGDSAEFGQPDGRDFDFTRMRDILISRFPRRVIHRINKVYYRRNDLNNVYSDEPTTNGFQTFLEREVKVAYFGTQQSAFFSTPFSIRQIKESILSDERFYVHDELFNPRDHLNIGNGFIFKEGRKVPYDHEGDYYFSHVLPVTDLDAKAPEFEALVEKVLPDADLRRLLQQAVGTAILGARTRSFFYFIGGGKNGKSLLTDTFLSVFRPIARRLDDKSITKRENATSLDPGLEQGMDSRILVVSEVEKGKFLSENTLKALTGDSIIPVRNLYEKERQAEFKGTIIIGANDLLRTKDTSGAINDRLRFIPFEQRLEKLDRENYAQYFSDNEAPGIINWAIAGYKDYIDSNRTFCESAKSEAVGKSYREGSQTLLEFVRVVQENEDIGEIQTRPDGKKVKVMQVRRFYEAYYTYMEETHQKPAFTNSGVAFKEELSRVDGVIRLFQNYERDPLKVEFDLLEQSGPPTRILNPAGNNS